MRRQAARIALVTGVLAAVLAGCGTSPTPQSEVAPDDPVTSAPATGAPEVEPDDGGQDPAPSVSLPQLPVGGTGEFVDDTQDLQCASVSWIVDESGPGALRQGIRIAITGAKVDERFFALADSGCEDRGENCVGYVFTADSDSPACQLAVRTQRPLTREVDNTSLTLAGSVECRDVEAWECDAFLAAAEEGSGSVSLSPPLPDAPEETPEETPEEAPASPSPESAAPEPSPTGG